MEKLTLRQFSDVVKALVEAGLSKENKKYNLKITETPNAGEDESIRIVMTIKAEKEKEEKAEQSYRNRKYSYSMTLNMNAQYHTYIMMLEHEIPQAEVLKRMSNNIIKCILEEKICFDWEESEVASSEESCQQHENNKPKCDDTEEYRCSGCENDDEDLDEDWADEELDDLDCMRRKCIAKACLIFAAIPVGLFIVKNLLKKD